MPIIKLDKNDIKLIRELCDKTLLFDREIAELFGVTRGHITKIRNNKRWNYEYGESTNDAIRNAIERGITIRG